MIRSVLIASWVLGVGAPSTPHPAPTPAAARAPALKPLPSADDLPYLSLEGLVKRTTDSKIPYVVKPDDSPPGGCADSLWPLGIPPVDLPRVVVENGRRVVHEWPLAPEMEALMAQAVKHLEAQRYDEAEKLSRQILAACPDCYLAHEYLGNIALARRDPKTALAHFRRALRLNPDDSRLHSDLGSALMQLGQREAAREALAWALVLAPRDPTLRKQLGALRGVGMEFKGDVIIPRGFAYEKDGEMIILHDPLFGPAWIVFGTCKAVWHADAEHRREMTGRSEHFFNSVEDLECLSLTALAYALQKRPPVQEPLDPTLDRLLDVVKDNMLTELVLFEVMPRIHPQITLTFDDEIRQRLWKYVLKHVLVPVDPKRNTGPD
jgi:tetratricopeptide (TPR) repeat protein